MRHFRLSAIGIALLLLLTGCHGTVIAEEQPVDGEGRVLAVSPNVITVGVRTTLVFQFEVGEHGIAPGGGVALGLHHAAAWEPPQLEDPDKPAYCTVTMPMKVRLMFSWHGWAPKDMFPRSDHGDLDGIFHQVLIAKSPVAIPAGMVLTFTLGANEAGIRPPAAVDPTHEFHFSTDSDGDGRYKGIADQPQLPIVPGPPHHLAAVTPAMVKVNQPLSVLLRVEDRFFNPVAGHFEEPITVRDESGRIVAEVAAVTDGVARTEVVAGAPGPQRLRLSAGKLEGRSNPFRVFEKLPDQRIYWGDIHGHTSISDGLGPDAATYYTFARDVAGLDVCALSDHGHFDWPQTQAAAKAFHAPGRFVTLLAQESGAGPDHMNFYFRDDDAPHLQGWPSRYDQLFEMLQTQYNSGPEPRVLTGPHHFSYDRGDDRYPFGLWDTRSARFIEVYSSHGTSEFLGNPRPCQGAKDPRKFMQYGLAQGLRFGVLASSDNHDSHPGRTIWGHYPGGLAAFLAPELTREAVWDAWWNYHTYGTSFDRIYVECTMDGHPMGSEWRTGEPVALRYYVIGKTDGLSAHLLRDNEVIRVDKSGTGVIDVTFKDDVPQGDHFYYLRVEQENGERAWTSPFWVHRD